MQHNKLVEAAAAIVNGLGYAERLRPHYDAALASDSDQALTDFIQKYGKEIARQDRLVAAILRRLNSHKFKIRKAAA